MQWASSGKHNMGQEWWARYGSAVWVRYNGPVVVGMIWCKTDKDGFFAYLQCESVCTDRNPQLYRLGKSSQLTSSTTART